MPLLIGALAWLWWLPAAVRGRAEAAAERLGLEAEVGGASLGFARVTLEAVRLRGRHGGLSVDIDALVVRGSLWAMAFSGFSSVERVELDGGRAHLDLSAPGASRSLDAIDEALAARRGGVGHPGGAGAAGRPSVGARAVGIEVDDAHGPLLRVRQGELVEQPGTLRLGAGSIELGGAPGHQLAIAGARADLARSVEGALWLTAASAAGAEISWAREPTETAEGGAPPDRPRLLARLRALREALPRAGGAEGPAEEGPEPAWVGRLAPEATVRLAGASVRARTEEGEEEILRELTAEVVHRGGGRFDLDGSGSPVSGGSLRWDLRVDPLALRAAGAISFADLPLALVAPLLPEVPWHQPEDARLDGEVTIEGDATEPLRIDGRLTVRDAALSSARIAPGPVRGITLTLEGRATFHSPERRLEIAEATLILGGASVQLAGAVEWAPGHYLFDLTATLPSTDCGRAVAAIPPDLLADLAGFSWSGRIGGRLVAHVDSRDLERTRLDIDVADACRFDTVPAAADLRRVQGPFLHRVREPDGSWFEMTTGPGTAHWASIHSVSPFLIHAVLAHEDASFFRHRGFAPWAIRDALERNLREGRYVVGASTITMQLAKNLFLHREKTLARKVQEVLLTWWLESSLDKRAILELYLNVIEYGPGIYGIRSAAWHYFGREPADLGPAEAAFIANVLPNPKVYHHQYERGELSNSMRNRMQRLLRHMHARGRIDAAAVEHGLSRVSTFSFRREGQPPPEPRELPGSTAPLPFATGAPTWDDVWEGWGLEAFDDVPEEEVVD